MGITELCQRINDKNIVKIHRGVAINRHYVASVKKDELGHMLVLIKGRSEVMRVSKPFQNVFRAL